MRNLDLMRVPPSRVAEDVSRVPQMPAPISEPILRQPVCGRKLMKVLWESDLSGKAMDFIIRLVEVLTKNGHILMLRPDGALKVYNPTAEGRMVGQIGILESDLSAVKKMEVDLGVLGVPEERLRELSIPAFGVFMKKSEFQTLLRNQFFSYEDISMLEKSTRVVFAMNPEMELKQVTFLEMDGILLYLDVKAMQEVPEYAALRLSQDKVLA